MGFFSDLKKINADRRAAKAAVRNFIAQHRVHILALLATTSGNLYVFPDRIVRDRTSEPPLPRRHTADLHAGGRRQRSAELPLRREDVTT